MRKYTIWLLFSVIVLGCTKQKQHEDFFNKERTFTEFQEMEISDSIEIAETFDILSWKINANNLCFVTYGVTNNFLSVYSYPSCRKLYGYGKIGQGSNEFITLNCGDAIAKDILLYDIMGHKLVQVTPEHDSIRVVKTLPLYNDGKGLCKPFTFISQIADDKYLMKVDESNFSYWDIVDLAQGEILDSYKNLIRKEKSSYTPFDFIQNISDSTLIIAYKYIDRIEIYSITDNKIKPRFALGNKNNQSDIKDYNNLMQYYLSVATYSGLILCLKSSDGTETGDIIETYDFNGSPKETYFLKKKVSSINVDADGHIVGYVSAIDKTILYRFIKKDK